MEKEKFSAISYKVSIEFLLSSPENAQEEEIEIVLSNEKNLGDPFQGIIKLPVKIPLKISKEMLQIILQKIERTIVITIINRLAYIQDCMAKVAITNNPSAFPCMEKPEFICSEMAWFTELWDYCHYFIEFAEKYDHYYKITKKAQRLYKTEEKKLLKKGYNYERSTIESQNKVMESKQFPNEIIELLGKRSASEIAYICTACYFGENAIDNQDQIARNFKDDLKKGRNLLPYKNELEQLVKVFFKQSIEILGSRIEEQLQDKQKQQPTEFPQNILKQVRHVFPTTKHLSEDIRPEAEEMKRFILSIINTKHNKIKEQQQY